jgi:leucyl aminopeptidase
MKKIDIVFLYNSLSNNNTINIIINTNSVIIKLNVFGIDNYIFCKELNKLNNIIKLYDSIKRINVIFDKNINVCLANKILSKLHDILYQYYKITRGIKLYQAKYESMNLMTELYLYKNIIMAPNKNPNTYLEYVKSRIPSTHEIICYDVKNSNNFPLTKAVGMGSQYDGNFVHIKPKQEKTGKNIYLVGKAITFDSGGMNIKDSSMIDMKIDMTGSAIILSVLNLISNEKLIHNNNIHLILPIVENMIGNTATRPGYVVETICGKMVEITDTDAEGRLCLADGFGFIQKNLIENKNHSQCLILDIATLTGNTTSITNGITSIITSNDKGLVYTNKLISIGDKMGEYLDYIKIRPEYLDFLESKVADIRNLPRSAKAGCIIAASFLNYFINKSIPWVHIDLGKGTYVDEMAQSHGVNLLYEFLKNQ